MNLFAVGQKAEVFSIEKPVADFLRRDQICLCVRPAAEGSLTVMYADNRMALLKGDYKKPDYRNGPADSFIISVSNPIAQTQSTGYLVFDGTPDLSLGNSKNAVYAIYDWSFQAYVRYRLDEICYKIREVE